MFSNDLLNDVLSRIGIYADDTTLYTSLGKSVIFLVESAGELDFTPHLLTTKVVHSIFVQPDSFSPTFAYI